MHPANISGDSRKTKALASTSYHHNHLTTTEALSFLSQFASAALRTDRAQCLELISKLRTFSENSNRNRSLLSSAGAASVLATAFRSFAGGGGGGERVLEEILSALVLLMPVEDDELFLNIASLESLYSLVSIIKFGDSIGRRNAVLVLNQIVRFDRDLARAAGRMDGLIEALMCLIRVPISPRARKASLLSVFYIVPCSDSLISERFVNMGLVDLILEFLAESCSERKMIEAGLAALDRLCECVKGREKANGNALTVPMLVVKMFRVSDLATELAVSALWKLCENWEGGEEEEMVGCVIEALQQVGVFLKLLMLLQLECSKVARERATKLLRFLRDFGAGGGIGCVDVRDFRGVGRISG